jgi:anti-anti-sigma factor
MFARSLSRFAITVEGDYDLRIVRPVGELDISTVAEFAPIVERECSSKANLVVDLTGLSFLDCAGLRVLLYAHALANSNGGTFRLIAGSTIVQRIFHLTGLDDRFRFIAPDALERTRRFQRRPHPQVGKVADTP